MCLDWERDFISSASSPLSVGESWTRVCATLGETGPGESPGLCGPGSGL